MEKVKNASMDPPSPLIPHFTNFGISCTRYSPIAELSLTSKTEPKEVLNDEVQPPPQVCAPTLYHSPPNKKKLAVSQSSYSGRPQKSFQNLPRGMSKTDGAEHLAVATPPSQKRVCSKTQSMGGLATPSGEVRKSSRQQQTTFGTSMAMGRF